VAERAAKEVKADFDSASTSRQFSRMLPLWYQVGESIRTDIHERVATGDLRLPTESQMAEDYGVSIVTMRQALAALEQEGLISRIRRRGTMINPVAARGKDLKVLGTLAAVWNMAFEEPPKLLAKQKVKPAPDMQALFKNATALTYFERLRHAQGEPINYCINYVLPEYGEKITKRDIEKWPISRILKDKLGVRISRMDYIVKAVGATGPVAQNLNLKANTPVTFFSASVYDEADRLIEVGHIYYRADRFEFSVSIDMR
jgi:GntR family transcriptional regulator